MKSSILKNQQIIKTKKWLASLQNTISIQLTNPKDVEIIVKHDGNIAAKQSFTTYWSSNTLVFYLNYIVPVTLYPYKEICLFVNEMLQFWRKKVQECKMEHDRKQVWKE